MATKTIKSTEEKGKSYANGFEDIYYKPIDLTAFQIGADSKPVYQSGKILVSLKNTSNNQVQQVEMVPFAKTILRQVSFK